MECLREFKCKHKLLKKKKINLNGWVSSVWAADYGSRAELSTIFQVHLRAQTPPTLFVNSLLVVQYLQTPVKKNKKQKKPH